MIKFAVMTFMYETWAEKAGSHEELLRIIAKAGAQGIEAFCNPFMENEKRLNLYKNILSDNNLKMPLMDLIANLAISDKSRRIAEYEKMKKGIDICSELETEIVHVAGCHIVENVSPTNGRKLIAEGLMAFVADVEKRGMTLAFENFDPSPSLICSAGDCLEILQLCEGKVKFVFDTGNFEAVGEYAENNFNKLIKHTCHFHFKDFQFVPETKKRTGTYFGHGYVKNRLIGQMIRNSEYHGWIALESYLQNGNGPKETITPELSLLKSWI